MCRCGIRSGPIVALRIAIFTLDSPDHLKATTGAFFFQRPHDVGLNSEGAGRVSAVALHGSAVVVGSSSPRNFLPWGSGLSVPLTARALNRFAWNPAEPRWNLFRYTPTMPCNIPLAASQSLRVSNARARQVIDRDAVDHQRRPEFVACACQEDSTIITDDPHYDHHCGQGHGANTVVGSGTVIMRSCCHAHLLTAPTVIAVLSNVHVCRC